MSRKKPPVARSANALRVPGTRETACSMSIAVRSRVARSSPSTWMPRGLRIPVASISVRVWIGIHHTFGMPGILDPLVHLPDRDRSQVMPGRHSIPWLEDDDHLRHAERRRVRRGAGASHLAEDGSDLGDLLGARRSMSWMSSVASVIDIPGGAVGMYRITPSFRGGMNSRREPEVRGNREDDGDERGEHDPVAMPHHEANDGRVARDSGRG